MQEDYLISIIGRQKVDDNNNEVSLTTSGSYQTDGTNRYITYKEYNSETAKEILSTLKIEDNNKVTLVRDGSEYYKLFLETGKRHVCSYNTDFGNITFGVFTNRIESDLSDSGGNLKINYSLDVNADLASLNEIIINVKEKNNPNV